MRLCSKFLPKRSRPKKALKAWKLETTHFAELIAEIGPKLNEVYDRMESWHQENEDI